MSHQIESGQYRVRIIWQGGEESILHFPAIGFEIHTPRESVHLRGEKALRLLQTYASKYTRDNFSWNKILEEEKTNL